MRFLRGGALLPGELQSRLSSWGTLGYQHTTHQNGHVPSLPIGYLLKDAGSMAQEPTAARLPDLDSDLVPLHSSLWSVLGFSNHGWTF